MNKERLKIELKLLGINAIMPILIATIPFFIALASAANKLGEINAFTTTELFLPMVSGWITIFAFKDILNKRYGETIFTYRVSRIKLGLGRMLKFFMCYLVIAFIQSIVLCKIFEFANFMPFFLHIVLSGLFISALAFLVMTFIGNCEITLALIIGYMITTFLAAANGIYGFSVLNFVAFSLPIDKLIQWGIKCLIITMILLIIGQVNFNRFAKRIKVH